MSRLTIALRAAPLLAIVLGIVFAASAPRPAVASGTVSLAVTLTPAEPPCDGSPVRFTLRATNADGSPAANTAVHVLLPNGGEPSTIVTETTNRRGVAHVVVTPEAGLHDRFFYVATVDGGSGPHLSVASCPLSDSKDFFITGSIFLDRNGDGVRDPGDRALRHEAISINGGCTGIGCALPPHTVRTDRLGNFEFTGLTQVDPNRQPLPDFFMCLPNTQGPNRHIVSVNGAPVTFAPGGCADIGTLQPGENIIAIGVQ